MARLSSFIRSDKAFFSSLVMLCTGGLLLVRMSHILLRSFSASPWFKFALEIAVSVEVIISTIGNLTGITAKFNPFARRETSLSDSSRSERFFTHLFLSSVVIIWVFEVRQSSEVELPDSCFKLINLFFCLSFFTSCWCNWAEFTKFLTFQTHQKEVFPRALWCGL